MLRFLPCFGVAISPNPTWTACTALQIAQPLPPLTLIFTCPWCHSEVTLSAVTSSARDLTRLHIIHRLLLCPAGQGRPPLFKFCSEMLPLTLEWPQYHCRHDIPFTDLNTPPPLAPASSCTPSTPLYTDFLCLLADPLEFEDPPSRFPVTERTHRWLAMIAVVACFLRGRP
jgi:hypothetical protein